MYDGYFESPAQIQARFDRIKANMAQRKAAVNQPITTREYLKRLAEHGNTVISPEVMTIQDVLMLYEQLDSLQDSLRDANEGAKLMHSLATGGESKLLKDWDLLDGCGNDSDLHDLAIGR